LQQSSGLQSRIWYQSIEIEIEEAIKFPPPQTRAWFRGQCITRFSAELIAASWDSVILNLGEAENLTRILMPDPYQGGREQTQAAIHGSISSLREALAHIFQVT
jgi:hypothetical protein